MLRLDAKKPIIEDAAAKKSLPDKVSINNFHQIGSKI
jgi:hypothetical protein